MKTYRCKVVDEVTWDGRDLDGRLHSNPMGWAYQYYDGVIIDTLTGAVTYRSGRRELWSVVRRGHDQGNDYVLTTEPRPDDPLEDAMFRATNQSIRIRTWGGKSMRGSAGEVVWPRGATPRFLANHLSEFVSGPCEVVR